MELVGDSPSHQQPKKSKTQIPITSTQSSNTKPEFVYPILLPLDIISEILSRLPVKPLSRFRCVSKEWCSLISSSEFVKLHLKALDFRKDYAHHKILSSFDRSQTFSFKQCSLQSVISEPVTESVELDYPTKSPNISPWIVGSCNGLVCIEIDWDLYIWNPTTGKFKKVDSSYILGFRFGYRYLTYGFGYDKLNDDYKVFWVLGSSCENENKVMVYSLRNDFWRIIGGLKGEVLVESTNKCVNGKIHFAVRPSFSSSSSSRWEIVSLDLATEVYGRVEQPNYGEIESYLTLEVISGYLCVLCEYQRTHTDLWVMREYGVNESWTKMLTNRPFDMIVTIPPLNDPWNKCFSFPFCISKNGEVVLVLDSTIVVYDPKTKVLRYPEITNFGGIFEAEIYVESLVSPIAYSESRREQQH